jgi:hypothetical protein
MLNLFILSGYVKYIRETEYTGKPSLKITLEVDNQTYIIFTAPTLVDKKDLLLNSYSAFKGELHCINDTAYLYAERVSIVTLEK